jgi:hypothetical protein
VISADSASVRTLGYGEGQFGVVPYDGGPRVDVQLIASEQVNVHWIISEMFERVENLIELMKTKSIIYTAVTPKPEISHEL